MKRIIFILILLFSIWHVWSNTIDNLPREPVIQTQVIETQVVEYKREEIKPIREETELLYVIDWDTIKINYKWEDRSLRLLWIDAPESNDYRYWYIEEWWEEAKEYLKSLLYWNDVEIFIDSEEDYYWRLLWTIYVDWVNINNKMVQDWYALYYK